jgi:hypothetical protein
VVLVSVGPVAQNAVVGGVSPFDVSTQLTNPDVPVPVVSVVEMLLEKIIFGGAVGSVKS